MPYSALFAQSKSYFTHKVRGCQTFLQRIDKLFYINISPAFPLSSVPHLFFRSAYITCRRARHSTAPRFYPFARPARTAFLQKDLPVEYSRQFQRHSGSYFFGFASAFSDRTVQPSLDHRHTESCPRYTLFPAQARKARPSPAPEFLFSAHLSARARPPCAHSDRQPRVNIRTGSRRLISRKAFCRRIGRRF